MLLKNGLITPASRAIELDNVLLPIFCPHLIDPILEAIQLKEAAIAPGPKAFNGSENALRR